MKMAQTFSVGDRVYRHGINSKGVVVAINGEWLNVQFDGFSEVVGCQPEWLTLATEASR